MPVWLSVPHPCFDNKRLPGWKHSCCSGASLQKMKPLRWKLAFQHISTLNNVSWKYATKFVESEFVSCKTFKWTFRGFSRSNRVPNIFLGSPVSPRLFWSSIYQEMWKWSQSSMQCVCGLEVFKIPSCGRPHVINKVIFSPRVKRQTKQNQSTVHLGGTHFQSAQIIYIVTTIYSLIMFNQYDWTYHIRLSKSHSQC